MQNLFLYLAATEKFGNCFRFGNIIAPEPKAEGLWNNMRVCKIVKFPVSDITEALGIFFLTFTFNNFFHVWRDPRLSVS